ncbi:hypothetical protein GQ457_06G014490 [Hibiscus cannabinus]
MAPPIEISDDLVSDSQVFSNKIVNVCLTQTNYLLWKQQVVLTVRGFGLEGYLDGSFSAPARMVHNRENEQIVNPLYLQYVKQDSSLASWLLSTVSADILPQLVGAETTAAVWGAITKLYSSHSTTKVMNLHCRLRSLKKGTLSMREYTMAVKETCDHLATCGSSITDIEHIATILNGLPVEYEPSVAAITTSKESYTVDNVVSILIDAETRMEDVSRFPVGIHFTKFNHKQSTNDDLDSLANKDDHQDSSRNGFVNRFKGRSRPQCQLCGKLGHSVERCWHRFDQNFKGINTQQSTQGRNMSKVQINTCMCCNRSTEGDYNPYVSTTADPLCDGDVQDKFQSSAVPVVTQSAPSTPAQSTQTISTTTASPAQSITVPFGYNNSPLDNLSTGQSPSQIVHSSGHSQADIPQGPSSASSDDNNATTVGSMPAELDLDLPVEPDLVTCTNPVPEQEVVIVCERVHDVEVNGVSLDEGPVPMCFNPCSATGGDAECNKFCVSKGYVDGHCVGRARECCCTVLLHTKLSMI